MRFICTPPPPPPSPSPFLPFNIPCIPLYSAQRDDIQELYDRKVSVGGGGLGDENTCIRRFRRSTDSPHPSAGPLDGMNAPTKTLHDDLQSALLSKTDSNSPYFVNQGSSGSPSGGGFHIIQQPLSSSMEQREEEYKKMMIDFCQGPLLEMMSPLLLRRETNVNSQDIAKQVVLNVNKTVAQAWQLKDLHQLVEGLR